MRYIRILKIFSVNSVRAPQKSRGNPPCGKLKNALAYHTCCSNLCNMYSFCCVEHDTFTRPTRPAVTCVRDVNTNASRTVSIVGAARDKRMVQLRVAGTTTSQAAPTMEPVRCRVSRNRLMYFHSTKNSTKMSGAVLHA